MLFFVMYIKQNYLLLKKLCRLPRTETKEMLVHSITKTINNLQTDKCMTAIPATTCNFVQIFIIYQI